MEILSCPLHCLVHDVVRTFLVQFVQKATHSCITDDVNCAVEVIGVHHWLDVGKDVLTRGKRHNDSVGILGVDEFVCKDLTLVCIKGGDGSTIKGSTENTGALEVLPLKVFHIVNLIVGVCCLYHSETYGIGGESNANELGGVLCISDCTTTHIADSDTSVIVDYGHLEGLTHRCNRFVTHLTCKEWVRPALLNEEIECSVLAQTMLVLVKKRIIDTNILQHCSC